MAKAKYVLERPTFNEIELIIQSQEELDVFLALTGAVNTKEELPRIMEKSLHRTKWTEEHAEAQFSLYDAVYNTIKGE